MYRTKKDVDKHVDNLISKLSVKEFKTRAYSVARLYYEVGDYASCQRYVEQYLTQKDNNAAAHKLLGQALQKLGQKEKALEQFKMSLDIDPTQTSTILDICELLANDEMIIDPGRAKYWCEKAEATFPRHPVTFRLREKLLTVANPDPEEFVKLLTTELSLRPKDVTLHSRLLKHYLRTNKVKLAFDHSCIVEFGGQNFPNSYTWYDTIAEIFTHNSLTTNDWLYQLLLLTVRERMCVLSLTETPSGSSKSLVETSELLHEYDQALELVAKTGAPSGFGEFHAALLQHHKGQFALHAATYILKKAKKDQLSWRDATKTAAPLMLIAWQTVPLDPKVNWIMHASEKQKISVQRWYREGTYRCSQSGHYLLSNIQDKCQSFLDRVSQICSGVNWREKLYEKIFTNKVHLAKIKSSYFGSTAFSTPVLRIPRRIEVEAYDMDAQREYPNSLHHFVWILLNYKNYAHFKCVLFNMLTPTATNCGPETLNTLDIDAFLYFATLTSRQQKSNDYSFIATEKLKVLPANITDLLCPLAQMKWWDCAYKFSQNELGTELTDIRSTLSRGIEVVRCIDNHGLDPELLCYTGRIFSERAKLTTIVDIKTKLETRAGLYYSSAMPLLEKLKSKIIIKIPEKRFFDYTHKELDLKELNSLLEESKLYVAANHLNACEYDKVIELLSNLKTPDSYYHLSQAYKKLAIEENNFSKDNSIDKSKFITLMMKAKNYAYKALDKVKDTEFNKNHPLYSDIQQLIEETETQINKIDPDLSGNNDVDGKYSSDENISSAGSEHVHLRNNHHITFRNLSSTPKQPSNPNLTAYRTAVDLQMQETTRIDPHFFDKIENQIKSFQKRLADDFMEQTKGWFEENKRLSNQIMSTIQSDIQNTTDQFKLLKISVDQVKDQVNECRSECKDVGELKKQIAELKREVHKLKKTSSDQTNEDELYNLEEDYRTNESTSFSSQLSYQNPQVMPSFSQRLIPPFPIPPNPYQLYNQSLYNLYNQYAQFSQTPSVPGAPPIFDPAKLAYSGVYPTPDQMYLDVANLVPPTVPPAPSVPPVPSMPAVPPATPVVVSTAPQTITSVAIAKPSTSAELKDSTRSLPVNVVITSSDPLPTSNTAPQQILSVTIPPKHIKGTPHNYQIPMPSTNATNVVSPPVFSFPSSGNKSLAATTASPVTNWNQSVFKTATCNASSSIFNTSILNSTLENSVVDGTAASPNTSLNKSRTLSERSNTSVENYDPCPDFKPIIPLPAEVKVTTGEEDENVIFCARAKLFRFADKQWKERGIGEMKLLKHKLTGKVRVLMRREQVHKICANHIIVSEMDINPMKNETRAYFWVANDFADETVVLEKFCIRFKTADIAQEFYKLFDKARQEAKVSNTAIEAKAIVKNPETVKIDKPSETAISAKAGFSYPAVVSTPQQSKTVFGGFSFSSTPTFKTIDDEAKPSAKVPEPTTTKVNVFSNLSFKTTASSPFSNILSTTSTAAISITSDSSTAQNQGSSSKLNTSDVVEEFEPNVEFKPIIPLPALVDQKTGEENENILYECRAKLLRYDGTSKEWKERGLGNIKLLVQRDNVQKVRLLMRRERIMKVCCNHAVTKDMVFQKMPNMGNAVNWCAKDFSEGELVAETFCLRFKNDVFCDEFMAALQSAQSKMKDESKVAKEEQNAAKQSNQDGGFGDKFKPKPGSWQCDACYTNNLENFLKCACCEQPKPQSGAIVPASTGTPAVLNWGDKFKPKPGSWECSSCLIRNEANIEYCTACNSPKDPGMPNKEKTLANNNLPKFNFGIPSAQSTAKTENNTVSSSGFGDKFKPKEGSWECKKCYIINENNVEKCAACASLRNSNSNNNDQSNTIFGNVTPGPKFNFGIPNTNTATSFDPKPKTETTSIFDGTGGHNFSFGVPSPAQEKGSSNVVLFGNKVPMIFGVPTTNATNEGPLNLISNKSENKTATPVKPALLPTPVTGQTLGDTETHATFDFVFKPKTPPKGKSPMKSPKAHGDESDGNEYASEDEGHHIHFSPVVPLPDKVEVVTGEENEMELYGHRAKLYRFFGGEWKERGVGVVKILKHKDTGKLRVVMRREQVLKICLNHTLSADINYISKDDKTWLFGANDFSEGELNYQQFCLKFKSKEIALEFKEAVEQARAGKETIIKSKSDRDNKCSDSEDVIFVSETLATAEEKQKAKELMLPENFYTYKNMAPCKGCRGCNNDAEIEPKLETNSNSIKTSTPSLSSIESTPVKTTAMVFQSPMTSFYGTPSNFDKTGDASIFRTPLGSFGSNTNSASPSTTSDTLGNDSMNKENTFTQKNIFGTREKSNLFTVPQNNPIFGAGEAQTSDTTATPILAAPKLNTSGLEKPSSEIKSLFGNANTGISSNKSIFSLPSDNKSQVSSKPEVKSIFGDDQKPVNLFSGANQGSMFGLAALSNNQQKSTTFGNFGSVGQTKGFDSSKSIFQNTSNTTPSWTFGSNTDEKKFAENSAAINIEEKKEEIQNDTRKVTPFKIDNNLSFAALSSGGSEKASFSTQKNSDFKWEGAGQQLFTGSQKSQSNDNSKNAGDGADESGAGADEEYDPHYEPIVPLPEKIVVTTGEEDEEKLFGERCKLFRYDEKNKEWKERGVGELKILHHPVKNTYRLLLRREQVHKAVLNMLIFMDLELLPMKNSDRAWTWAGCNFAENSLGEQEALAVRFKSVDLANIFKDRVTECTRKMQAAAAQAVREKTAAAEQVGVAPLRLPKHLESSARADNDLSAKVEQTTVATVQSLVPPNGDYKAEISKQVHFQEPGKQADEEADEEDYDYYQNEDYDAYDNEDEESAAYYECEAEAVVQQGGAGAGAATLCESAHVQVLFDQDCCSPKILVTDLDTGETLADMLIHTDTEFQMSGDSCTWSGTDYTSNDAVDKTVTINFQNSDHAIQFYDSCETSKGATYSSTDPES